MEEKPRDGDKSAEVEPMPDNASVVEIGPKPSVWKEFWKGCHDLFWQSYGLDKVAEDVDTHGEAVRKGAALRFLAIIAVFALVGGFGLKGCLNDSKMDSIKEDLAKSDGAKLEAERDRDKYQIEAQNSDNALAPWKELANSQFPGKPINESLNSLLQKVETLQDDIDSKMQSMPIPRLMSQKVKSLNTPIAGGTYQTKVSIEVQNANENTFISWNCPFLISKPEFKPTGSGIGFGPSISAPFSTAEITFITSAPIQESDVQIIIGSKPPSSVPSTSASPP